MRLITREQWGAQHGDGGDWRPLPATEAWLHHSVTIAPDLEWVSTDGDGVDDDEQAAMRHIEDIGRDRFGDEYGFPYSAAFMPRGNCAYAGHHPAKMGAHTYRHNDEGVGFVLVGNYEKHRPTSAQLDAVAWGLVHFKRRGWLQRARITGGHRDVKATACPGRYAYQAIPEINRRAAALERGDNMPTAREVVDELLTRDVVDRPGEHTDNPEWQLLYAFEGMWRQATWANKESRRNGRKLDRTERKVDRVAAAIDAMAESLPTEVRDAVRAELADAVDDGLAIKGNVDVTVGGGDQA